MSHRLRLILGVLATATFLYGSSSLPQQVWEKQDFHTWSKKDCQKILSDSPWAREFRIEESLVELLQEPSSDRAREGRPWIIYRVQFRSAPPLRRAIVRRSALEAQYDRMSPDQKQSFDAQAETYLSTEFPDQVLIHVIYESNVPAYEGDLARYWQRQTTDLVRNAIFLLPHRGAKVSPLRFVAGQGAVHEFDLFFPRMVNGLPILKPDDTSVAVEFQHPDVGILRTQRVFLEFKVSRMRSGAQLLY